MIIDPPGLSSPRLLLRSLNSIDLDGPYFEWLHDVEVTRYLEVRFNKPNRDALSRFVKQMNDSPADLLLGMFVRDRDKHIGNIRLGPIDRHHRRGTLGILVGDRTFWRQGYATEAIATVSAYAFDVLGLAKLSAGIYDTNQGSLRAFLNAGFQVEAVRRSHAVLDGMRIDVSELAKFRSEVSP